MTNGPHTLGAGYGSLLKWRALRVWIRSRLNSSGKCRIKQSQWRKVITDGTKTSITPASKISDEQKITIDSSHDQ